MCAGGYTGFAVARDLLRMDLSPAQQDDSDADSMKGEIQAPPALPMTANLTPDQLRKAKKHRRKYGLAQPRPNSPKPKLKHPVKTSELYYFASYHKLGLPATELAQDVKCTCLLILPTAIMLRVLCS